MSIKNSSDTIGNLTRYLSACIALPQLTASTRAPADSIKTQIYELNKFTGNSRVFMFMVPRIAGLY